MNDFPFGEQWYVLERFPLHSQATRLPLMEKGRMYLSRASQVGGQDSAVYGMHVPSSPHGSLPLCPCGGTVLQHQFVVESAGVGLSPTRWLWWQWCSNTTQTICFHLLPLLPGIVPWERPATGSELFDV